MEDYQRFLARVDARPYLTRSDLEIHIHAWVPRTVTWEPVYLEGVGGNGQRILLRDGEEVFASVPFQVLTEFVCKPYFMELKDLKAQYRAITGMSQNMPLVARGGKVFVAVKCRNHPRGKNDGTMRYIDMAAIRGIEVTKSGCNIHLISGHVVTSVWTAHGVRDRMDKAKLFCDKLREREVIEAVPAIEPVPVF